MPPGTWTFVLTKGLPVEANGWEQLVYAPILKRAVMFSQYHQRNSEPNESMVSYNFETNSWEVLDMGGNFHTETMPEGGESQGYFDFNPNNNTIIYHCCTTGSNQPENANHTWWYDLLGQSGRDKHTSPKPPAPALQPGGAFDAAHNVFIFHGGDSQVGTWSYDPVANIWQQLHPAGTAPDPSLILPAVAYRSRTQKIYLFGGLSGSGYFNDLYVYDYPTNTWSLVSPAGGLKPSARYRHAFAYDSTNDIFLMYGGQNASGNLDDTWVFNPSTNAWTQVNAPQSPPVPTTSIFAKLTYDSDHNVFILAQTGPNGYYGGSWSAYAVQTWLFRYNGTGPNAGYLSSSSAPSLGSLNRNTAGWAKDPTLVSDGSSLYVGWSEVGTPFDLTDSAWAHIYVSQYSAGSWIPVGASFSSVSSTPIKEAHAPSLAIVAGKPWASWYESDNAGHTAQVYAKGWDGAAWQGGAVGLNGTSTRLFQGQSQITAVGTVPHVAVLEVDKDVYPQRTLAYVRSWNGSAWSLKGAALNQNTGAGSTALSVSLTTDGTRPYAAWSEYLHIANTGNGYDNDTNPKIYVSQWNGTQWVTVGGALNVNTANWAYDPSIAYLNGQLYVAWTERAQAGDAKLYVKTWNGSSWTLVGTGALNRAPATGWAFHPSLVADTTNNRLYLGWVEQTALGQKAQVFISRYAAGAWTSLGGSLNVDPTLGSAQRVSLGVFNSQPVAAWGEVNLGALRQVYVKQWNGSSWTQLAGSGGPPDTTAPSIPGTPLAIGTSSSQINVAWTAAQDTVGVTGYTIYRNGAPIATVTSTLAYSDTGLSPNTSYSYRIAAFDATGNTSPQSGAATAITFPSVTGSGGSLSASLGTPASTVQLTTEGTLDWAHWGLSNAGSFNHKAGVTQQISNYTALGGPVTQYSNNPVGFTWTDGTPTSTATNTTTGVTIAGLLQGFRISAPADTTSRTLRVYIGALHTQGRMTAQLSDGSAPDYVATFSSSPSGPVTLGVYTFTYRAASSGQSLLVTFTQGTLAPGNVTLQAATLSGGSPTPDFTISGTPSARSVTAGVSTTYGVAIASLRGFSGTVNFSVSGLPAGASPSFSPTTVTGSGSSTLTISTTAATAAGTYPLTITATSGTLIHTTGISLTVTTPASGGVLSGSLLTPTGTISLTTEGSADWAHWGLTTATDFNHKATVTQQISNFTVVGAGTPARYANNSVGYSWTDGTPTVTATNSTTGVFIAGTGSGFRVTAPADVALRTLKIYVGAWQAQGRLQAQLSDGSAADFVDTSLSNSAGVTTLGVYTLTYQAASNGQTLTVSYTLNSGAGNVTLQAATLAGGITTPNFNLSATPSSQNVAAGNGTSYNVTVGALNGYSGTVSLMVSGLPSGVSAGFSPATVTGSGSSTLTVTTTAAVAPGTYPLTITGSDGSLTHTTGVSLTVTAAPNFTLGVSPSSKSIAVGANSTFTATVGAVSGFSGVVGFTVSGLPSGVTAGLSPATVTGSGSSTLTLTVAAGTVAGTYPLTITGTSGTLIHTAGASLTVTAAPNFTLAMSPSSKSIVVGANGTFTATVAAVSGFSGVVGFTVSGLPSGVTAGFNPATVTGSGSSTLTLTVAAGTVVGTYPLTITGTSGILVHTAGASLTVTPAADFTLSGTPPSQTVVAGGNAGYTVTVGALSGFSGTVSFTTSGLPGGASAGFSPATVTGSGTSTLTVTTTAAVAAGTYPFTVTGTSGTLIHTVNLSLTVTVPVGGGALSGSMLTPTGPVPLTTEGSADWGHWGLNAAGDFNHKAGVTQQISNYTLVGTVTPARYANNAIGYTWTDGTPTASTTNSTTGIFVTGAGNGFSLTAPADTSVRTLKVYVGAWRTQGRLVAHLSDGSAADFVDTSLSNNSGVTTLGVYTLNYQAAGAGQTLTVVYTNNTSNGNVTLQAATLSGGIATPNFTMGASPSSQTVAAGSSGTYTVTVTALNGYNRVVGFTASGLPSGVSAGFSPATVTGGGSSSLTLTVAAGTAAGSYPVTITGSDGTLSHTANITLMVSQPPNFTIGASPASRSVTAGSSAAYTLTVGALNGFNGVVMFSTSSLPAGANAGFSPATVTGSGSTTLTITTTVGTTPPGSYPVTVTAASSTLSHTANITLTVTAAVSSGTLNGSVSTPVGPVQLTTTGTLDWAHWGLYTASDFNHKARETPLISNYTIVGGGSPSRYTNNSVGYTWTDGAAPNTTVTNATTGLFVAGLNKGFQITVPADTITRTLKVYVGTWRVRGKLVAHLSDGSAVDYTDSSIVNTSGVTTLGVYTFTYKAASAGRTLTVSFTQNTLATGNVTLQAATVSQ